MCWPSLQTVNFIYIYKKQNFIKKSERYKLRGQGVHHQYKGPNKMKNINPKSTVNLTTLEQIMQQKAKKATAT